MSSKNNIAKEIKREILNNDPDYDYIYNLIESNVQNGLSGLFNSYLYLFRNIDNIYNENIINNLNNLLSNYIKKEKNKQTLELIYDKIDVFLSNLSKSLSYNELLKAESYISTLVNLQNKCLINNMKKAKGDKYNFITFLIFEKRDLELLSKYLMDNMKELLINNSIIVSVFTNIIEKYIEIDENNITEIKYYNRVINLFLRGKMYDKLLNNNHDYLLILKNSNKNFVWDLIDKIENDYVMTEDSAARDYDVSFNIPSREKYTYIPNGKLDLTSENIITIDNKEDLCLDDALSVRKNSDGTCTLFIHLANPASIIPYASYTMKEALHRCNTLYLIDNNIPIFDKYLSDNMLSLLPNKKTNAITVIARVDTDYSLDLDTIKIVPSVIESKHKLTYEEVDDIIINEKELYNDLLLLTNIFNKQAIDNPKISAYHRLENIIKGRNNPNSLNADKSISHMLVEQSNVFANTVISIINKRDNLDLVMPYRVQTENCDGLITEYLKDGKFDKDNKAIRELLKGYMMKSKYSITNTGHSGLGVDGYIRISSAARRAMDTLAIYALYDQYFNRDILDIDAKHYYWENEIKYWCDYANNRTSDNSLFIDEYNYLAHKGKILKK